MKEVEHHEASDGRTFRTFTVPCFHMDPCWQGRCQCGEALTKHDDTREMSIRCSLEALRKDHPTCRRRK